MALIVVFWSAIFMASIAAVLVADGSSASHLAYNAAVAAQRRLNTEAAIARTVSALADPRPAHRWLANGVPHAFEFSGDKMTISVTAELGRIDLNQTDCPVLETVFHRAGLAPAESEVLCERVLDWRGGQSASRRTSGRSVDDDASGLAYRPRRAPYQSIGEVLLVRGFPRALYERISSSLTVHSQKHGIDPRLASADTLALLPQYSASDIERFLSDRASESGSGGQSIFQAVVGQAYAIDIAHVTTGRRRMERAVVRLTNNPSAPFWLLALDARQ